jgi:hypothetical protein
MIFKRKRAWDDEGILHRDEFIIQAGYVCQVPNFENLLKMRPDVELERSPDCVD